jgi:hypothetical protein
MEHLGKSSGRISDMLNCRRALTLRMNSGDTILNSSKGL